LSPGRQSRRIADPTGEIVSTAQFLNDKLDGVSQVIIRGVLTVEENYSAGQLHGSYRSWWEDGAAKEQGTYHRGKRVGIYRWYKLDGSLWNEHDYG
jgi:antitoxin component YwqK of YwqJK toxin-antitoxin module